MEYQIYCLENHDHENADIIIINHFNENSIRSISEIKKFGWILKNLVMN